MAFFDDLDEIDKILDDANHQDEYLKVTVNRDVSFDLLEDALDIMKKLKLYKEKSKALEEAIGSILMDEILDWLRRASEL